MPWRVWRRSCSRERAVRIPTHRGGRPSERGQVDARQPAVRPARSDRPRHARRHARPGRARSGLAWQAVRSGRHRGVRAGRHAASRSSRACRPTRAMREADLILLVVDAQAGITEDDAALARRLRRSSVPVLVVANKVDGAAEESDAAAFHRAGTWRAPVAVSGMHGRATGDLLDRIVELLPDAPEVREDDDLEPRFAMVGRPNVGQVEPVQPARRRGALRGVRRGRHDARRGRRRGRVAERAACGSSTPPGCGVRSRCKGVEYFSFVRATEAIDRADVVVLVIDAVEGLHRRRQEDREPRDGRGPSVPARRQQVGPRRREGQDVTRTSHETLRPFAHATRDANVGPQPDGRAPSAAGAARPPRAVDVEDPDLEGQRGDPAGAARAAHPARRRHAALRDAGEPPGRRRS